MRRIGIMALCLLLVMGMLAAASAEYAPGTYTGVGTGNNGEVKVDVEFSADAIVSITVTEHVETPGVGDMAIAQLPDKIIEAQALDVDVVTGASMTSGAILTAVADAVTQAGGDPAALGYVAAEAE